jgi:hypothetical protein
MRAISSFSLCCALVFSSDRSLPQTLPAPPPPLTDTYKGTDAIFTNWSGVDIYPGPSAGQPRYSVRYTICNLDPKNGLLFMWEKPALSTGFKNSLPPGKCMDSTHEARHLWPTTMPRSCSLRTTNPKTLAHIYPFIATTTTQTLPHTSKNGFLTVNRAV